MAEIREKATFEQRAERMLEVRTMYQAFREQVEQDFDLEQEDGRLVFLRNASAFARSAIVLLKVHHMCAANPPMGMQVFGQASADTFEENLKLSAKFVKLSWCVQFQFQLEVLFSNLLQVLGEPVPSGYWQKSERIVGLFSIPEDNAHARLNILAHMRNSQHANGIHHGYQGADTVVDVGGVLFEFRHDKLVQCANWDYIALAWESLKPILEHIYYHERVKALTEPLPDQYWS